MKNLKKILFFAIAIFALTLFSSCSADNFPKGDDPNEVSNENPDDNPIEVPGGNETQTDFIKFKYNGTSYSFDPSFSTSLTMDLSGYTGIDDTYKRVALWMPLKPTIGSHPVVFDLSHLETTYQASFSFLPEINNANATAGTINITLLTKERIEGTFSFSGMQNGKNFSVTDGSFSIEKF
ncbi:hypothetical protein EV144_102794 [Flavobacterium sp. 270]|uniref:hypothetical protein n=1 Tax=Flavobacterium sp. 270 TaxID=2512114 RepID=UPI0010668A1F|nr:hypothetical protein [Flavobacterium sp. 270]TDW50355.1 hypothetical protein EV144_102794 [Flavobacterium sp. 270]